MEAVRLLMTLEPFEPRIWRRVLVPDSFTLNGVHRVVQAAFGWEDCHLHRFEIDRVRYEVPDPEWPWDPPAPAWCEELLGRGVDPAEVEALRTPPRDERKVRLRDVVGRGVRRFEYLYDFGDGWDHTIEVEGVQQVDVGRLPALLEGERSGPPEDCGGIPGYEQILAAYAGERVDEWGRERAEWARAVMGWRWNPEHFDPELAQDRLSRTWRGRGPSERGRRARRPGDSGT
ncbi:MAG: plasmid pRiA4b ORF-3 family protein [Coriobacteriia bacterium]|nr:plasmid pRiA4b ORF-3 family protein [Coriobacteriia bacterium]